MKNISLAIIGSRGIPAKYGGFETFAEELATRLVKKGYKITVSCEYSPNKIKEYKGVKLCYFPYPPPKSYFLRKLYEILVDIYFIYKLSKNHDTIYLLGGGAGAFLFIAKIFNRKTKVLINIDGVEWKRAKFNFLEKGLLKLNIILGSLFADIIVLDAQAMKNYIAKSFHKKTVYIPYGIEDKKDINSVSYTHLTLPTN